MKRIFRPASRVSLPWLFLAACVGAGLSASLRAEKRALPLARFSEGSFDGRTDGFTLGQRLPAQLAGDFTIEMTVKPAAPQETNADIIDFNHRAVQGLVIQQLQDDTNNYVFHIGNGTVKTMFTYRLQTGVWQRVVFQREGTLLRLYVDGALAATQPCFPDPIDYLPDSDATIGYNKSYGRHFKGELKDVAVWAGAIKPNSVRDETSPIATYPSATLDGSAAGPSLGTNIAPQLSGDFTIEMTVKPAATQEALADIIDFNHRAVQGLVIQQNQDETNNYVFHIGNGTIKTMFMYRLQTGVWQRMVFQREGTQLRLYLDGTLVATQPCFPDPISYLPDSDATIGYNKCYGRHFRGEIRDLRIWNCARSVLSGSSAAPSLPGGGRGPAAAVQPETRASGRHYFVINYTGDTQNRHDFIIDSAARTVRELNQPTESRDQMLIVSTFQPHERLVMHTLISSTGYWIDYDWVFLEDGRIIAGCYRDRGSNGPSVGGLVPDSGAGL